MGVAAAAPAIHTVDLTKRFGGTVALTGLSMTVPRGEIFGFLGPNGAGKTLDTVGLTDRADDRVSTFSKGMQQRLGLAAALVGKPELVFLDEPTSALDPVGRHDVREIIRGLSDRGTAVFLNSHLLSEVEQVCDRVAVVDHGRVIASGTMDELLSGTAVKVRVSGLDDSARTNLAAFGPLDDEGEHLTFTKLDIERVPELVSTIVAMGGRVYEVSPRHQTLEDRFLQLLHEEET
jgi:ABC-2 type transport system ATP-binding protein